MPDEPETIEDAIEQAALAGIKKATGDNGSIENFDIEQLIAAKRFAQTQSSGLGIRIRKLVPPGAP
jgi:hypothetical protein